MDKRFIKDGFPDGMQAFGAALFRKVQMAPAGLNVPVPNNDMGVWIMAIHAPIVDGGKPRNKATCQFGHKAA